MDDPVLLVHWEKTLGELLDRTEKFPKSVRFTFVSRMDSLELQILEGLIRARWQPDARVVLLAQVDADLAVLRTLLRLAYARRYIDAGGLELLSKAFDEAGRMLGGWRKHSEERGA